MAVRDEDRAEAATAAPLNGDDDVIDDVTDDVAERGGGAGPRVGRAPGGGRLSPEDFDILRVIGQGAFGKVFQVQNRASGEILAMKVMRKDRILEKDHGDYLRAERDILTTVEHPYIVRLRCSFQTGSKLYLLLDFVNGGHLFFQLRLAGTFLEPLARHYTAEIVLAVEHLHSLGIAHRDLKPENILLGADGHVRVTDFGLAKPNMAGDNTSNSFIGTMEYMAPEIIIAKGHSRAADWWSVGVLLYEMLVGDTPFFSKNRQQLQRKITAEKPKFPAYLSAAAHGLLKALLQKDAKMRLGYEGGGKAIMAHPFFKGLDWAKLQRRELDPPFLPTVRDHRDTANFDELYTKMTPKDSPVPTPTGTCAAFLNFTYTSPGYMSRLAAREERSDSGGGGSPSPSPT